MTVPRIVVAGTESGVGKTSITSAIIYGLRKRGYSVKSFKVGPDFIDPSYLGAVSGTPSNNLDPWLMNDAGVTESFVRHSDSDFSVIEGVMGFYDGFSGESNYSSTHHVASILKAPVILTLDASGAARSIAATALGFVKFHKNSKISGFILNKIGSKKHEELCRKALASLDLPIVGVIPRNPNLSMESRHLGLIPVSEQRKLQSKISKIAKTISEFLDIEKIIMIGKKVPLLRPIPEKKKSRCKTTIAVALDESFNFYYQDNLEALRREGAKIEFFSPISDSKVPECDGIYIGGGFPEVLGNLLEKNSRIKKDVKKLAESGVPIYAECGGLMYLTRSIDYGSKKFEMVGLFDASTRMQKRLTLNYTKASISSDCLVGRPTDLIQGHEFHLSSLESISKDSRFAYNLLIGHGIRNQKDGMIQDNSLASYMHLHFSRPHIAHNFVQRCIKQSRR